MTDRRYRFSEVRAPGGLRVGNGIRPNPMEPLPPAFSPDGDYDQALRNRIRHDIDRQGIVPFSDVIDELTAKNSPAQLTQAGFPFIISQIGVANAFLVCPANPRRMSLKVCNSTDAGDLVFSYDSPLILNSVGVGVPVNAGTPYEETMGSVSINEIWVWSDDTTANFPIVGVIFEGVLSIVGNKT